MFINGRFEVSKVPCIFTSVGCVLPGSDTSPHASFTSCVAPRSFDAATLSIKLTWYNARSHRPRLHSVSPPLLRIKRSKYSARYLGDKHNNNNNNNHQKYNYPSVG